MDCVLPPYRLMPEHHRICVSFSRLPYLETILLSRIQSNLFLKISFGSGWSALGDDSGSLLSLDTAVHAAAGEHQLRSVDSTAFVGSQIIVALDCGR